MRIAGYYSFNDGADIIRAEQPALLAEVETAIRTIDDTRCRTKVSKEKGMVGRRLYAPKELNKAFKAQLKPLGWNPVRHNCDYSTKHYASDYDPRSLHAGAYREMDFVKERLGLEVQFGKYSFMVYNVAAKMTIFSNLDYIDRGIEIVPVKALAEEMSSGVSYFEQFAWDLDNRGRADIDIPVLIIGIDATDPTPTQIEDV